MLRAYSGPQGFLDRIEEAPVEVDQWQLEKFALVARKHTILFYTPGLTSKDMGALGPHSFSSAETAIANLLSGLPENARVAVIPEGPYAFARVRE